MAALASDWLRRFRLLPWHHWTEFNESWKEARSHYPNQVCVLRVDQKKQDGRPRPLLGWDIFEFSEPAAWNAWKLARKQELNVLFHACGFRVDREKKNKMSALTSDCLRNFRRHLKPLNRIQRNLTGSKISTPSTIFVFFGLIRKKNKMPAPASDWLIHFAFLSETAKRNSTKLERNQDLKEMCPVFFKFMQHRRRQTS